MSVKTYVCALTPPGGSTVVLDRAQDANMSWSDIWLAEGVTDRLAASRATGVAAKAVTRAVRSERETDVEDGILSEDGGS